MMAERDKRAAKRISHPCEVECDGVSVAESPLNPRISDISVTGAFVDSMIALPQGTILKLKFPLLSRDLFVDAEVCHSMPQFGMGVRFLNLTEEQRAVIEQFIREH